jgi:RNA polymerase sigma-70 factor (ECF subfamily)
VTEAELIDSLIARGQAAYPALPVAREVMVAAFERSVRDVGDRIAALGELVAEDLYLAQACAAGAAGAIEAFDGVCSATVTHSLRAMGLTDDTIADIAQEVRAKLFAGNGKIASYSGRASLKSWVRTIATRAAVDRLRKPEAEAASDEMLVGIPDAAPGPELDHFRARYHAEFKEAFEAALASLEVRERNVLRHHFIDRLSFEEIGALYGVHKTTAFRWLEDARDKLSKRTRNQFQDRVQLTPNEMESVLRLLQSNIDLSLSRVL